MPLAPPPTEEEQSATPAPTADPFASVPEPRRTHVSNTNLAPALKARLYDAATDPNMDDSGFKFTLNQLKVDPAHAKLLTDLRTKGANQTIAPPPSAMDYAKSAVTGVQSVLKDVSGAFGESPVQTSPPGIQPPPTNPNFAMDMGLPAVAPSDFIPRIKAPMIAPEASTWDIVKGVFSALPESRRLETDPSTGLKRFAGGDATMQQYQTPYGIYGTLANMAGGLLGGITASHYNAETGEFTPPKWMTTDPTTATYAFMPPPAPIQLRKRSLSDILSKDIGVPEQVAKDGTAAQVGNFVGSIVPWTAISKTLGALTGIADSAAVQTIAESTAVSKLPEVMKTVAAKNVLDIGKELLKRAGIQAATGATFEQLQPASLEESTKDWATRTGKAALYAGAISGVVDGGG